MAGRDFLSLEVKGFDKVFRRMEKLPKVMRTSILNKTLREGAKIFQQEAKTRTPKRPNAKGRILKRQNILQKALVVRASKTKRRGEASINVNYNVDKYPSLVKTTKAGKRHFLPSILEYGSDKRNIKPRKFLRKAFHIKKHFISDRVKRRTIVLTERAIRSL